ncbi:uncharacterized protein N7458_009644 [Penicillium daleae]|uniref:Uncharacterized protein n=1 Tax=Penicillium daleae TaxID=63821 RepID=A0AAD6BXE0_9EURO|nr:uncharacterized protein N7458_009644 [Penicillium daleae]KAJ5438646.1 hypothetical protein N7458_009644 [Penicillium daleae]
MKPKNSFHIHKRLRNAFSSLWRRLHKAKQFASNIIRRPAGPQTDDIEMQDLFNSQIRWPPPERNLPLWMRHGRPEMPPILVHVECDDLIPCHIRLAPHEDLWPYVHCRGCDCGAKSGYVRCLCIECTFFHGVNVWSPCLDAAPISFWDRKQERLARVLDPR